MSEIDFSRASVLLFDPVHVNQRTTRYALFEIGFRKIECVSNLNEFKNALRETAPTLVVAESSATDADIFRIVKAVRRSELGSNPFVIFLLTTWSRDTNQIRRAIECGADDVIVRPFSTAFAEERVKVLVKNRKEFIVTSEYIGPDRRKETERSSDIVPIKVPNFLQATVEGDLKSLAEASVWIKEAHSAIVSERLRRLAMRIVISVELQINKKEDEHVKLDIADLTKSARELKSQLMNAKRPEAAEIAEALIDQIACIVTEAGTDEKALKLTKELAMGTFAAYANGESLERSSNEIGRTVTNLRKRIKSRTKTAALKSTQNNKNDKVAAEESAAGVKVQEKTANGAGKAA